MSALRPCLVLLLVGTSCLLLRTGLRGGADDGGPDAAAPDGLVPGDADAEGDGEDGRAEGDVDSPVPADADEVDDAPDGDRDLESSDGSSDAEVPEEPVGPVDLPVAGPHGSHPAVAWTGTEFVVGYVVGDLGAQQVEIVRFGPGEVPPATGDPVTTAPGTYEDVSLAPAGGSLAVGWIAEVSGAWEAQVRVLPGDPAPTTAYGPLGHESDRDDAHVHWVGSRLAVTVRTAEPAGDALRWLPAGSPGEIELVAARDDSVGELSLRAIGLGPAVAAGGGTAVHLRSAGAWSSVTVTGLGEGSEGDLAELDDGSLLTAWLHRPDPAGDRLLHAARLEPEAGSYRQRSSPLSLPFAGSDPALAAVGSTALLAFSYTPTPEDRLLGLVMLDGDGAPLGVPCSVPPARPVANDPDVACGAGVCAVAWMEASAYDADDFITRILQVPVVPGLVCP